MLVIKERNVNQALSTALLTLLSKGELRSSRNGSVLAFPTPVATVYERPCERVLFSPIRNANPTFHLLESLWMLAGRNDVKFPGTFVKNMKNYSDDGGTFWGAYGHRWRNFFGWDQISACVEELRTNPESRRVVMAMWDAAGESEGPALGDSDPDFIVGQKGGKDVPCNTHIYFDRRDGRLNMTVCCRSNDILWGCYGANAVHMSILQEYMALSIGCPVGVYTQFSNDLHLYNSAVPEVGLKALAWDAINADRYSNMASAKPTPLWGDFEDRYLFDLDNTNLFLGFDQGGLDGAIGAPYCTRFFQGTVVPMLQAWAYRNTSRDAAINMASEIKAEDWGFAMRQWLEPKA